MNLDLTVEKSKNYLSIYDDDAHVTIEMHDKDVKSLIGLLDESIRNGSDKSFTYRNLSLDLQHFEGGLFSVSARDENNNYFHDFELESIDLEVWDNIISLI